MKKEFDYMIVNEFKGLYDKGYRCINYEVDKTDNSFTVFLKNFEKENSKTLKCSIDEGNILKNYIDGLS